MRTSTLAIKDDSIRCDKCKIRRPSREFCIGKKITYSLCKSCRSLKKKNLEQTIQGATAFPKSFDLTARDLAERLGLSVWGIRKWRAREFLPEHCMLKLPHGVRYNWDLVVEFLSTRKS